MNVLRMSRYRRMIDIGWTWLRYYSYPDPRNKSYAGPPFLNSTQHSCPRKHNSIVHDSRLELRTVAQSYPRAFIIKSNYYLWRRGRGQKCGRILLYQPLLLPARNGRPECQSDTTQPTDGGTGVELEPNGGTIMLGSKSISFSPWCNGISPIRLFVLFLKDE